MATPVKNIRLNILADATRAKREMKDVNTDADKLDKRKITPTVGLDTAPFKKDLGPLTVDMDKLGKRNIMPKISIDDAEAKKKLTAFGLDFDKFSKKRAELGVSVQDNEAKRKLISLNLEMDRIGKYVMRPDIDVIGEQRAIERILKVSAAMDELSRKTAHVSIDEDVNKKGGLFSGLSTDLSTALSGAFKDAIPVAEEGGSSLMSSIGEGMGPMGAVIGVAIAGALAVTPGLIAAATGLGVGLGGVVIAAMTNPKFKKQLGGFFSGIERDLGKDVQPIISAMGPILSQISGFVKSESGPLRSMFAASIPSLKTFVGVLEQFGRQLIPAVTQALKTLRPDLPILAKGFGTLLDAVVEFIKVIGPAIKPSIIVFMEFAKIAKAALIAVGVAADIMAVAFRVAFTETKIIIEVFINVVKSVWVILRDLFEGKFGQIAKDLNKVWGGLWRELLGELKAFWQNIKGPLTDIWHFAVKIFGDIENGVKRIWGDVWSWAKSRLRQFSSDVANIWDGILSFARNVFGKIESGVKRIWDDLWNWAKQRIKAFSSDVASIWDNILSFARSVFGKIESAVKNIWSDLWSWARSRLKAFSSDVASIWDGIWSFAKSVFGKIESTVKNIWSDLWTWARNTLHNVGGDIHDLWNDMLADGRHIFDTIRTTIHNIWSDLWRSAQNIVHDAGQGLHNFFEDINHDIGHVFSVISTDVKHTWSAMWRDLKGAADTGVRWIGNAINAIGGFWNTVSSHLHLGLPHFSPVKLANGGMVNQEDAGNFASGGRVGGQGSGDTVHAMLTPGEAVIPRRLVGSHALQLKSEGVPGFAMGGGVGTADRPFHFAGGGGVPSGAGKPSGGGSPGVQNLDGNGQPVSSDKGFLGSITHAFANVGHALAGAASGVIKNLNPGGKGFVGNAITDLKKDAINVVFNPIKTLVGDAVKSVAGTAGLGDMVASGATTLLSDIINKLDASATAKEASAGGSGSAIAAYAKQFVGHRYVLGGSGDYQSKHSPPFGPWDCAGFVTQMYEHFGIHPTGTVNVSGLYGWAGAHMKKPTVGGMAFFPGADGTMSAPGHVGMVTGPNQMVNAEDERDGTRMASLAGAAWFGIPKGGFPGGSGGFSGTGGTAIYTYLLNNVFNGDKIAATGALASIWGESGWNPESVGTGGNGIIGWTPPRPGIVTGNPTKDMAKQLPMVSDFIRQSGDEGVIQEMMHAGTILEAANLWGRGVERFGINDVHSAGINAAKAIANSVGNSTAATAKGGGSRGNTQSLANKKHLALGGWIGEPVFGQGLRTGASYAIAENGPEYVTPAGNMQGRGSGGGNTYHFRIEAGVSSPADVGEAVVKVITKYEQRSGKRGANAVFNK